MSIEYRADANLRDEIVAALLDDVANGGAWSVVSRGERDLVLRWAAHVGSETLSDANIEVAPDRHKQGLATHLLSEAFRELHQQGVTLIEAQAMEHNPAAIALYHRLGFTAIDHGSVLRKE